MGKPGAGVLSGKEACTCSRKRAAAIVTRVVEIIMIVIKVIVLLLLQIVAVAVVKVKLEESLRSPLSYFVPSYHEDRDYKTTLRITHQL